jgi:peptidoglycan/LPS O-acetylase OafA/YrhL
VVAAASLVLLNWNMMFVQLPQIAAAPSIVFIWFSNLTLLFQDWFLFLGFDNGRLVPVLSYENSPKQVWLFLLVPQCWSLGIELTFYLIAPFACRRWQSVALLFAFGLVTRAVLAWFVPAGDPWTYRFAPNEMMMFAAGGLAYFAGRNLCPRFPRATAIACFISLAAITALIVAEPYLSRITTEWDGLVPILLIRNSPALLLMTVAAAPLFYGTRSNRFDQIAGELSYPMYVSHYTIMSLMARNSMLPPDNGLYVVIVIAVSFLLFFGITIPTDRLRKRFGARDLSQVTSVGITTVTSTAS